MKEFNRNAKANGSTGCGNVKEYRMQNDFEFTQNLCKSVIQDVMYFSEESAGSCGYSIDDVLAQIHLADINDCIYFEYCQKNKGLEQIDPKKDYKKSSLHDLRNMAAYYVEQSCFYDVTDFDEQYKIDEIVYHNDKNKEHGNNN